MHKVLISLASNHEQEKNLCAARQALAQILSACVYTDAIWTEPVAGSPSQMKYLNQLVSAQTKLNADELTCFLKQIELQMGRTPQMRQKKIVPIDLDLLAYDGVRHHERDWQRSYVKQLLSLLSQL
jgi:2-amino-4-hydroxy-6-hydroxymethyldihydropteridine diphosphokinase